MAFLQCDYAVSHRYLERTLTLLDTGGGDRRAEAITRQRLGSIAREQARYAEAQDLHTQSLAIWESLGDPEGVASAQNYLGFVAWLSGEFDRTDALCLDALTEFRRAGNLRDVAVSLISLGVAAVYRGESAPGGGEARRSPGDLTAPWLPGGHRLVAA